MNLGRPALYGVVKMTANLSPRPADERGVFLLLGPAGSGKGTVAGRLLTDGLISRHVSMGELLRELVAQADDGLAARLNASLPHPDPLGEVRQALQAGALIPDPWTEVMIERALDGLQGETFALDGFPRRVGAATHLLHALAERAIPIQRAFHLSLPDAEVRRRLLARGRPDDTEEAISARLEVYRSEVTPTIAYLKDRLPPTSVVEIDANANPDDVYGRVMDLFNPGSPA